MIWPRLHTARSLLAEDGVMVISIDDREEGRLILLMDEIFGEENALGHIVWKHTEQSKNDERFFSRHFNSLLLYFSMPATGKLCRRFASRGRHHTTARTEIPTRIREGTGAPATSAARACGPV